MVFPFRHCSSLPALSRSRKDIKRSWRPTKPTRRYSFRFTARVLAVFATIAVILAGSYRFVGVIKDRPDRVPLSGGAMVDHFAHFEGWQDCGVSSLDIYLPPVKHNRHELEPLSFCNNRETLLDAMSGGGRHGFDAPFVPKGCHYRWYTSHEICMILQRFDGVVFIGDGLVRSVYVAFNSLLRQNLALGGLRQWDMDDTQSASCRCENQFIKLECSGFAVASSEEVTANDARSGHSSPYTCGGTHHLYLPISGSPASADAQRTLSRFLGANMESYKPIPVVHSVSLGGSLSWQTATASMEEWLTLADTFVEDSSRQVPFLWLGPVAAGHLKPPGQILSQGNNAVWHYTVEMAREARKRGMETLGLYNMTLQASSWDGTAYGERVALVQAMMVVNWLARLETT